MSHEYHSSSVHLLLVAGKGRLNRNRADCVCHQSLGEFWNALWSAKSNGLVTYPLDQSLKCDHKMLRIGITESVSQSVSGVFFVAFIITGDELELREVAKVSRLSGGSLSFISVHTRHDMESFIINDHMLRWWTESLSGWNTRLDRRQIKGSIAY